LIHDPLRLAEAVDKLPTSLLEVLFDVVHFVYDRRRKATQWHLRRGVLQVVVHLAHDIENEVAAGAVRGQLDLYLNGLAPIVVCVHVGVTECEALFSLSGFAPRMRLGPVVVKMSDLVGERFEAHTHVIAQQVEALFGVPPAPPPPPPRALTHHIGGRGVRIRTLHIRPSFWR